MDDIIPDATLDITNDICPMTFVRTRLKLETMTQGQILQVTLGKGEPVNNVPRSVSDLGNEVIALVENGDTPDTYKLIIRKG